MIDTFVAAFPNTPLLFTTGNPWGDEDGITDQEWIEDYILTVDNGRAGICDSFLKAKSTHTFTYLKRDYPWGEQAIGQGGNGAEQQPRSGSQRNALHRVPLLKDQRPSQPLSLRQQPCGACPEAER